MRKGFLTWVFVLAGAFLLHAQCEGCPAVSGEIIDCCYMEELLPGKCAQFTQDSKTFYYIDSKRKKGAQLKLALPESLAVPTTAYLLGLDPDHELKLAAADLLVIAHGIELWRQLEGIRLWDADIINSGYSLLPSGLAYKPIKVGHGKRPEIGKRVTVHYTGYLDCGTKFDSSLDRKQTFQFTLGLGQVIKGWDEGLAIMTVGSRYLLKIPPTLGYGEAGAGRGVIPPNATLFFDVQLISAE
jgi:hypothetical protein